MMQRARNLKLPTFALAIAAALGSGQALPAATKVKLTDAHILPNGS
jgi:hypothetical protein